MTRTAWLAELTALTMRAARLPETKHPAYRALCAKIDRLIEHGLQHEFITIREAETL